MVEIKRPMLAEDAIEEKIKFPCIVQTKVDGCRLIHITGKATGRSLKQYKNKHTSDYYSSPLFMGFDGEAYVGTDMYAQDLCRKTTSALNTIKGEPIISWMLFDLIDETTIDIPYVSRLELLEGVVQESKQYAGFENVHVVPWQVVHTLEELLAFEKTELAKGAEGIIIRDPDGMFKQGRSTVKEGGLLRVKRFVDEEAVVLAVREGNKNTNSEKINELGYVERSSHKENMIPNGEVGTIICKSLKTGAELDVSPGNMTQKDCKYYFKHQDEIIGKVITFKHFPKGRKGDNYRFPTFKHFRDMEVDYSE